jgi:hypothetical protein
MRRAGASFVRKSWPAQREAAVERFVSRKWCRRVVLDQVMDGWFDRIGCDDGSEAACDVCQRQIIQSRFEEDITWVEREEEEARKPIEGLSQGDDEGLEAQVQAQAQSQAQARFEQSQRGHRYEQFKARQNQMKTSQEVKTFEEELGLMAGRCVGCFMATERFEEDQFHEHEACPIRDQRWWERQFEQEQQWQGQIFKKGVMAPYSGCFWCGVPQAICTHWEAVKDDQGVFRLKRDGVCQYAGVLIRVWVAATRLSIG